MATYNFSNFQIPQTGVDGAWDQAEAQQSRSFTTKLSIFGALNVGNRSSTDYTKLDIAFADAQINPSVPEDIKDENPFVTGSTVKRVRNDEAMVMLLGSRRATNASLPAFDVMSTKLTGNPTKDGTVPLNYPEEGYVSFGGRTGGPFNYRVSK